MFAVHHKGSCLGEYTTFSCSACGYSAEHIRWGVGVTDPRVRFLPGRCDRCREIIEVELTGRDPLIEEFRCRRCNSLIFFFEKGQSYGCPRCGTPNLRILQLDYW